MILEVMCTLTTVATVYCIIASLINPQSISVAMVFKMSQDCVTEA